MITLGIDPGTRNIGLATVEDTNHVQKVWSFKTESGDWREAYFSVLKELKGVSFNRVVIENVGWYGNRKGMYALNRLVGALWGFVVAKRKTVLLAMPKDKVKLNRSTRRLAKNEHEADAIALAFWGNQQWSKLTKKTRNRAGTKLRRAMQKEGQSIDRSEENSIPGSPAPGVI